MKIDCLYFLVILVSLGLQTPINAQVIHDNTVGTKVTPNILINGILSNRIDGGTIRGVNLFQSFSELNIAKGNGVYFTNPNGINNIFSRVTGPNPSIIDGTLGVLGNANLFLLNPNGIVFGVNAKLDVKGSFLSTTASSINFADGTEFSVANPQSTSLLTVSVPVGLGFGSNPGAITLLSSGLYLQPIFTPFAPLVRNPTATGLAVPAGKTLAIVGGDISLSNSFLTAPSGRIEIGGVGANSLVKLNSTAQGFTLDYAGVSQFGDVNFTQQSVADVSGSSAGSIQLQGRQISLSDGSILWGQNQGLQPGGSINVYASESLQINGTSSLNQVQSGLVTETVGLGKGGNISVVTPQLLIQSGGILESRTYTSAVTGDINIQAATAGLNGFALNNPLFNSALGTLTYGSGYAGRSTIATSQLTIQNGAALGSITYSNGQGGDVIVNANSIDISGSSLAYPSAISSLGFAAGRGGNVTINTNTLVVRDGGTVAVTGSSSGDAGDLIVNAANSVNISGASSIQSNITVSSPVLQEFLNLPDFASGKAGNLTINTPNLQILNGGSISVSNSSIGDGGALEINANSIKLDDSGITAGAAISGHGGNITINANNLVLRNNSLISAQAGNQGDGGNILLDVGAIAQLEGSTISANAGQGNGGNITISTEGFFQSPDSIITATSGLGINGTINILTPVINQENALIKQSSNFISLEQVVASSCITERNVAQGKFVVTGNGGLAETPEGNLEIPFVVVNVAVLPKTKVNHPQAILNQGWHLGDPIQEATQLISSVDGKQVLVVQPIDKPVNSQAIICQ
jgi:filamentous hemagglutinin family protein